MGQKPAGYSIRCINSSYLASYTVTFNANGGTGTMTPQTFTEGIPQSLNPNTFIKEGNDFGSWNTAADGSGTTFVNEQNITVASNMTLYAQWAGNDMPGTPCPGTETIQDAYGYTYNTVQIGTQCWMKENLKTTLYNDGTAIPYGSDNTDWYATTPVFGYYNNNTTYIDTYGALYNHYAVATGKLCPTGWHVPSKDEWSTLQYYLINNGYNWDGSGGTDKVAKSMAAISPGNKGTWADNSTEGAPGNISDTGEPKRNSSGFSAFPGGSRNWQGSANMGTSALFWTSEAYAGYDTFGWHCNMSNNFTAFGGGGSYKERTTGMSIRCLQN